MAQESALLTMGNPETVPDTIQAVSPLSNPLESTPESAAYDDLEEAVRKQTALQTSAGFPGTGIPNPTVASDVTRQATRCTPVSQIFQSTGPHRSRFSVHEIVIPSLQLRRQNLRLAHSPT